MKILEDYVFDTGIYKVKYFYYVEDIRYLKKLITMVKIERLTGFVEFIEEFKELHGYDLHIEDIEKVNYIKEFNVSE